MSPATQKDNDRGQAVEVGTASSNTINFSFPRHNTQASRLLAMLLHNERINPLRGWQELGIYRLSDTAFQLRGMGWPVTTGRLDVANRFNEPCYVAEYYLDAEAIAAAGHDGEEYAWHELEAMASTRRIA